nr:MAG TPA: hypothetical protein [Inoviridae sp.]
MPPFDVVSIFMFGVIHDMAPFSVIIVSFASRLQITTGNGSPLNIVVHKYPPLV